MYKTSQHAKGQAADFEIHGISNAELVKWISEHCDFDQMILEFHNVDEPNSGWVHCSYRSDGENRKQILRAYKNENNKTCYESYVPSWKEDREALRNDPEKIKDHMTLYRSN